MDLIDQVVRKATEAQAATGTAEYAASKRIGDEELLDVLYLIQKLAAQPGSLLVIEECGGGEFLIGERV